eukprot:2758550-Alexandrium_andersonii.AAC.1
METVPTEPSTSLGNTRNTKWLQECGALAMRAHERPRNQLPKLPRGVFRAVFRAGSESELERDCSVCSEKVP